MPVDDGRLAYALFGSLTKRNRVHSVKSLSQPHPRWIKAADFIRRDVAQPGRALAWGARGRQFKSARPDHSSFFSRCNQ